MRYRLALLLVTAFFATMNVLLWRSEFVGHGHLGAPVPAELIWEKVLTSPDPSYLEVRHAGRKVGRAHWTASIEETNTSAEFSDELLPEGMIKRFNGYSIGFDGNVALDDLTRLRFDFMLKLDTNQNWRELDLKLAIKPSPFSWEIHSSAEKQTVRFVATGDEEKIDRILTFAELRNPDKLARELGGPTLSGALASLGLPLPRAGASAATFGLKWDARNDRLQIGNNLVRVYRLEARLFERVKAAIFVSPVGEILRLELPGDVIMMNDALTNL
jgi:hypothetical protein